MQSPGFHKLCTQIYNNFLPIIFFLFYSSEEEENQENLTEISEDDQVTKSRKSTNTSVKRHKSGPKKYDCNICGKILSCRGNLNKHMIIHDDSKKFECDICQTKFNQQRDLNNHKMQKHTGL